MNGLLHEKGGIREILAIALPMVISQSSDTIMIFTGRFFLSKIDPGLMNAAMGGGLTVFMMISFFIGLTGYATALVAQYLGAGMKKNCPVVITQALIISVLAYLPILACRPLIHRLFESMGVSPEQLSPQKIYFDILLYGAIISLSRTSLSSFFSGIGRTGTVMVASLTAMFVNAFAEYILIFGKLGFEPMGIRGAAYGAIIGSASGLAILALSYFKKKNLDEFFTRRSFRFDWNITKKLLRFGSPTGFEMFLNIMAFNGIVLTFHSCGIVTATAATIMFNWDLVSVVPLIGFEIAVTSLVGRFMGAGDPDTAHKSAISGFKLSLWYSVLIFILFVGIPGYLTEIFRPSGMNDIFQQAIPLAVFMIRMASLYVLVEAMLVVFIGALRGAGDTFWAMSMSVSLHWIMVIVLTVIIRFLGLSPRIGWAFVVFVFVLFSVIVYLRYREGKWRSIKVIEESI